MCIGREASGFPVSCLQLDALFYFFYSHRYAIGYYHSHLSELNSSYYVNYPAFLCCKFRRFSLRLTVFQCMFPPHAKAYSKKGLRGNVLIQAALSPRRMKSHIHIKKSCVGKLETKSNSCQHFSKYVITFYGLVSNTFHFICHYICHFPVMEVELQYDSVCRVIFCKSLTCCAIKMLA